MVYFDKICKKTEFKCKSLHFILFLMNLHMQGKKIISQVFNFTFFERMFDLINIIIFLVQLMPNKSFYNVYYI
jgi:hypothetical protein